MQFWDADSGAVVKAVNAPESIFNMAYHPSGTPLAGASRDLVKIWDTVTYQEVLTLPRPTRDGDPGWNPASVSAPMVTG